MAYTVAHVFPPGHVRCRSLHTTPTGFKQNRWSWPSECRLRNRCGWTNDHERPELLSIKQPVASDDPGPNCTESELAQIAFMAFTEWSCSEDSAPVPPETDHRLWTYTTKRVENDKMDDICSMETFHQPLVRVHAFEFQSCCPTFSCPCFCLHGWR